MGWAQKAKRMVSNVPNLLWGLKQASGQILIQAANNKLKCFVKLNFEMLAQFELRMKFS